MRYFARKNEGLNVKKERETQRAERRQAVGWRRFSDLERSNKVQCLRRSSILLSSPQLFKWLVERVCVCGVWLVVEGSEECTGYDRKDRIISYTDTLMRSHAVPRSYIPSLLLSHLYNTHRTMPSLCFHDKHLQRGVRGNYICFLSSNFSAPQMMLLLTG